MPHGGTGTPNAYDVTYACNDTSTAIPESGLCTVFLIPT